MNEKNLDYLTRQVKYTGFGEGHADALKAKIEQQPSDFVLFHEANFGKDQVVATLQFKKSDETDLYFFNRYSMLLKNEAKPDETLKQTFYMGNNQDNITFKEAYNLMCGRAIHKEVTPKEGEKYNAWLQLNFKESDANGNYKVQQFHPNYGYYLPRVLNTHPIIELKDPEKTTKLIESLERGNRQSVTMELKGSEQKMFIEASPQFKGINFYDASMKRVNAQTLYEGNKESAKQNVKQDKQPGDEEDGTGMKKGKKKGEKIS